MAKKSREPSTELPIKEPLPNWVPLYKAPFSCLDDGMHTPATWAPACAEMAKRIESTLYKSPLLRSVKELLAVTGRPNWKISYYKDTVFVETMNLTMHICRTSITVHDEDSVALICGWSPEMLRDEEWEKYSSKKWKRAAAWHRNFIEAFLHDLHWNFEKQVSSGAAQLFARPRSPLAPFERIFPDQWNFMKLEPHEIEGRFIAWNDPKKPYWDPNRPMSARGPDGERIYSIYVAPGELRGVKNEREKCRQWLKPFMQNNPSRCPITVGELVDLLAAECSNEPKKVIRYWALEEIKEIGPPDWIKRGRRQRNGS